MYLVLQEIRSRIDRGGLDALYPADGPLRRELYTKHLKMFAAGAQHNERVVLGGNRVGKSFGIGGYETALHLTGLYPEWWEGKRYDRRILAWAAGTKSVKVRDTNQRILVGDLQQVRGVTVGTGGLIPKRYLGRITRKSGVSDAIDQVVVRHKLGHESILTFKSYEEGRTAFEAEAVDWIWLDEEPPKQIYDECRMRLLTTRGSVISTLTPVEGMTETVLSLLEGTDLL